jgi:hypothetical protein
MKEKKGNRFRVPQNQQDALTLALKLAISAPSKKQLEKVTQLAKELALGMSEFEIARCKKRALQELGMQT